MMIEKWVVVLCASMSLWACEVAGDTSNGGQVDTGMVEGAGGGAGEGGEGGGAGGNVGGEGEGEGEGEVCVPTGDEVCDGVDNDCNELVDDVAGLGEDCTVGEGACEADGTTLCGDEGIVCDAEAGAPGEEVCNGVDDDCDGLIDDDVAGVDEACADGLGACEARGRTACVDGEVLCDAVAGEPAVEVCDGVDNDCDGDVDDGFESVGGACAAGEGVCQAEGVWICAPDGGSVLCNAAPGAASPEVCDGLDNDCDGAVDEDEQGDPIAEACYSGPDATEGVGACRAGLRRCEGGRLGACLNDVVPVDEVCNGEDDDCVGPPTRAREGRCSPRSATTGQRPRRTSAPAARGPASAMVACSARARARCSPASRSATAWTTTATRRSTTSPASKSASASPATNRTATRARTGRATSANAPAGGRSAWKTAATSAPVKTRSCPTSRSATASTTTATPRSTISRTGCACAGRGHGATATRGRPTPRTSACARAASRSATGTAWATGAARAR